MLLTLSFFYVHLHVYFSLSDPGHGNTQTIKTPQKVNDISAVCQVSCGSNYTLALSLDNTTVWSFGPGNAGCLGHGNPHNQLKPKVLCSVYYI